MYYLKKEDDKIVIHERYKWQFRERALKDIIQLLDDGLYEVEIKKKRKVRSPNQNRFYWGAFLPVIAGEMGEDEDTAHEYLKTKFLPKQKKKRLQNPNNKRKYIVLKSSLSTTKLDTKEFEKYLEDIRIFFADWGWLLPYPNDYEF